MNNLQQVERLQTELAQTYSQLGQYGQAIALLCGSLKGEATCVEGSTLLAARAVPRSAGRNGGFRQFRRSPSAARGL